MTERGNDPLTPAGQVRLEGLPLQATQGQRHDALAVVGQCHGRGIRIDSGESHPADGLDPFQCVVLRMTCQRLGASALARGIDPADSGTVGLWPVGAVFDVG
jgi:hypothetical protein